MSIEKVIEKVDAIEVSNLQKIEEVKTEVAQTVESAKAEINEKFAALEAKVSAIQVPEIIKAPAKTVRGDVNRMVREQLRDYMKNTSKLDKEIKLWESADQYDA